MSQFSKSQFHFYRLNNESVRVIYTTPTNHHFYFCVLPEDARYLNEVRFASNPPQGAMRNLYSSILRLGLKCHEPFVL